MGTVDANTPPETYVDISVHTIVLFQPIMMEIETKIDDST